MALAYNYITLAAPTTTQVKSGAGFLHKIVVNKPVSTGTISIYDATSGTTNQIALITSTADVKPYELVFDCRFSTGLRIVTATAAQDITVVYQ